MRKRYRKRFILGIIISIFFSITCMSIPVFAKDAPNGIWTDYAATDFAGGSGTAEDPWQIETAEQLAKLSKDVAGGEKYSGKYFKLEKDAIEKINLSAIKVSGLIQNLLDNAIEENCRITDLEEREIKWTILQADFGLKMQIKNACLDIDKIDFETKKEEKELHGWGVKIIKEIVDEAQGTIQYIKEQNNRLKVIVFLPFQ